MSRLAGGQRLPPWTSHRDARAFVRKAVQPIAEGLDLARRVQPYEDRRFLPRQGEDCFLICLDDFSEIPFLNDIVGVEEYQHRARIRCVSPACYVTVTPIDTDYDVYWSERLGLTNAPRVPVEPPAGQRLAIARGCLEESTLDRLVSLIGAHKRVVIHPYMSIEPCWELARALHQTSPSINAAQVLGPPPPVTWVANDKGTFNEVVKAVLGPDWIPETRSANDAAGLAGHLEALSTLWPAVGLKRTRCASAMGNQVFDSSTLRGRPSEEIERRVAEFLARTEWTPGETVLAVAWETAAVSPSTQCWIGSGADGVTCEGVYEQILAGDRKVFVGSRTSTLPDDVDRTLRQAAYWISLALQELGYVGRCSFDHLVTGDPEGDYQVRFTECNGRWGGTSLPMALVERVAPHYQPAPGRFDPYRAQDVTFPGLAGACFGDVLELMGDELYDPSTRKGRFIFYNVGPLGRFGKFDVVALGATPEQADAAVMEDLPHLLKV